MHMLLSFGFLLLENIHFFFERNSGILDVIFLIHGILISHLSELVSIRSASWKDLKLFFIFSVIYEDVSLFHNTRVALDAPSWHLSLVMGYINIWHGKHVFIIADMELWLAFIPFLGNAACMTGWIWRSVETHFMSVHVNWAASPRGFNGLVVIVVLIVNIDSVYLVIRREWLLVLLYLLFLFFLPLMSRCLLKFCFHLKVNQLVWGGY